MPDGERPRMPEAAKLAGARPEAALPYGRQWVDDDIACVAEALRHDFLTTGPRIGEFESALAAATGARHAVALSSGTAALHAAYAAAGLAAGDEIVTTPLTFAATANAALYLGATVRFVDVEPDTGNLDPDRLEAAISPRTRLIVAVDFAGHPADYEAMSSIAAARGLRVVADAAHSLGASVDGRPVGTLAELSTLSFHPVKAITTGEGGAVLTDDADAAARVARFRTHGVARDRATSDGAWAQDAGAWYYEMRELGFNYRLTDVQAALGLSQLRRLSRFIARRAEIARRYTEALADLDARLTLPVVREGVSPAWHLYVVRVREPSRRRAFFDRLRALALGVQVHYIPVYRHPYYRALGYPDGACPNAEAFYERAVSLPIFPKMSDDDAESAIARVRRAAQATL